MDTLFEALWSLIRWPYRAWKHSIENSVIGASEEDLKALRFWKRVANVATILLVLGAVAIAALLFL